MSLKIERAKLTTTKRTVIFKELLPENELHHWEPSTYLPQQYSSSFFFLQGTLLGLSLLRIFHSFSPAISFLLSTTQVYFFGLATCIN